MRDERSLYNKSVFVNSVVFISLSSKKPICLSTAHYFYKIVPERKE